LATETFKENCAMYDDGTNDFTPRVPNTPPSKLALVTSHVERVLDFINKVGLAVGVACLMLFIGIGLGFGLAQGDIANIVRAEVASAANHIVRGCVSANGGWYDKKGLNCDLPPPGRARADGPSPGPASTGKPPRGDAT
jgi:hypothetical protein